MVNNTEYIAGRKAYGRPQAIIFTDSYDPATLLPVNYEKRSDTSGVQDFIILSDHNRSSLDFAFTRIEQRERMINGRMRSYHIADKATLTVSWEMLPSRAFSDNPEFNTTTGLVGANVVTHTADGGAGGVDLLNWYETHNGPFYVIVAYDKHTDFEQINEYNHLTEYNEVFEMYFSNFSYTVEKRGQTTFDFWTISLSLEEV